MHLTTTFVLLISVVSPYFTAASTPDGYDGVKVLRIPTGNDTAALDALIATLGLSTWTHASRGSSHIDVEVPSDTYDSFMSSVQAVLKKDGVVTPIEVMHDDLGESIRKEAQQFVGDYELSGQAELANNDWFNGYHPYQDHMTWLDDLVAAFPDNSKIVSSGTSVEGRDIKGVNIFGSAGSEKKPAIIWHGNVHAREWITSMTVEYLAYSLLNNYANETETKGFVDKFDFYIFPIVNPDGDQTENRMWRKNRQDPPDGSECYGRDLNRNWNVSWAQPHFGASRDPCQADFKGLAPSDTREISGLSAFLQARVASPPGAAMFVDWHSYSQLVLYPYGYDCDKKSQDEDEFDSLATGFASAVRKVNGTRFTTGPSCTTLYPTTGASMDYAYDILKIKYSFLIELRDEGQYGFILPPFMIRPSGEETWEGVKYLLRTMDVKDYNPGGNNDSTSALPNPTVPSSARTEIAGSLDRIVYMVVLGVYMFAMYGAGI